MGWLYEEPQELLENIKAEDINHVSEPFRFMTRQDSYYPTGNKWYPSAGFLPDEGRGDLELTMPCFPDCSINKQEISIVLGTDHFPNENFFTVFVDSFYEAWKGGSINDALIPVAGSTSFSFDEAPAFRAGPFRREYEMYTLNGCLNPQDKIKIGLMHLYGDGIDLNETATDDDVLDDDWDVPQQGHFEIWANTELIYSLTTTGFSCLMHELDVKTGNVAVDECTDEQKEFMDNTLVNY